MEQLGLPSEVIVDAKRRQLVGTQALEQTVREASPLGTGIKDLYSAADANYRADPDAYIKTLGDSVFSVEVGHGEVVDVALLPGAGEEVLVMWSPFADVAPRSSADQLNAYLGHADRSADQKRRAQPNTWNQLTKAAVTHEFLRAAGREMSVLTIFNPISARILSHRDFNDIRRGDYTPFKRIGTQALDAAQDRLHGPLSETQLARLHIHGASLGASYAVGHAYDTLDTGMECQSLTTQELIQGPAYVPVLGKRFLFEDPTGAPSTVPLTKDPRIKEPRLRRDIDIAGSEQPGTSLRAMAAMAKLTRLKGLTRPNRNETPDQLAVLLSRNVALMMPLAANSGPTQDTERALRFPYAELTESIVPIRAVADQRIGHLIDEHVGVTALLATLNILRTERP